MSQHIKERQTKLAHMVKGLNPDQKANIADKMGISPRRLAHLSRNWRDIKMDRMHILTSELELVYGADAVANWSELITEKPQ